MDVVTCSECSNDAMSCHVLVAQVKCQVFTNVIMSIIILCNQFIQLMSSKHEDTSTQTCTAAVDLSMIPTMMMVVQPGSGNPALGEPLVANPDDGAASADGSGQSAVQDEDPEVLEKLAQACSWRLLDFVQWSIFPLTA